MSNNKNMMTIASSIGVYLGLLKIFSEMLFFTTLKISLVISVILLILQLFISSAKAKKDDKNIDGVNMFTK